MPFIKNPERIDDETLIYKNKFCKIFVEHNDDDTGNFNLRVDFDNDEYHYTNFKSWRKPAYKYLSEKLKKKKIYCIMKQNGDYYFRIFVFTDNSGDKLWSKKYTCERLNKGVFEKKLYPSKYWREVYKN
jgi:hypothetical protein